MIRVSTNVDLLHLKFLLKIPLFSKLENFNDIDSYSNYILEVFFK